ncbi:MAG: 4-vinyl reductase [Anaerolineaceae bacterium]|jgi:predicted hydrocarbon binding protein
MDIVHEFPCVSQIGKIMLEGVHDIVGQTGINAISSLVTSPLSVGFTQANREKKAFSELTAIQGVLEAMYGRQGGQGIALRAGRASSSLIFRKYGQRMGLNILDYQLLPTPTRIKVGLEELANMVSELCCGPFLATEDGEAWIWQVLTCPVCWQRQSESSVCYFIVGLLQEFVSTISGGKIYSIVETECLATGAESCTFRIYKQALE